VTIFSTKSVRFEIRDYDLVLSRDICNTSGAYDLRTPVAMSLQSL
jgi:hypothetical protein